MRQPFHTLTAVFHSLGAILMAVAVPMIAPAVVAIVGGEGSRSVAAFVTAALVAVVIGAALRFGLRRGQATDVQAWLVCATAWIVVSAVGAIPFAAIADMTWLDAWFESVSGFTTTGITLLESLEHRPASLLLWRGMTQWIGGLGIITMFFALVELPSGGHRLFFAESHKIRGPRIAPTAKSTLQILWGIYLLLTVAVAACLWLAGLSLFDAIAHAFTTVSTGGFSTHDASIGFYDSTLVEIIIAAGMTLSGMSFLIHYRLLRGDWRVLGRGVEIRWWWGLLALLIAIIYAEARGGASAADSGPGLRTIWFQVTSILTTTGYATEDIGGPVFGVAAKQLFLVMMLVGGCAGSTAGGFKVVRVAILFRSVGRQVFRIVAPSRARSSVVIDGEVVEARETDRVAALFFAWMLLLVMGGLVTALMSDLDALASFSGMFSALGNIGPCYISQAEMMELHPAIKVVYMGGMLAGRLEILPLALLFNRRAWQG